MLTIHTLREYVKFRGECVFYGIKIRRLVIIQPWELRITVAAHYNYGDIEDEYTFLEGVRRGVDAIDRGDVASQETVEAELDELLSQHSR